MKQNYEVKSRKLVKVNGEWTTVSVSYGRRDVPETNKIEGYTVEGGEWKRDENGELITVSKTYKKIHDDDDDNKFNKLIKKVDSLIAKYR